MNAIGNVLAAMVILIAASAALVGGSSDLLAGLDRGVADLVTSTGIFIASFVIPFLGLLWFGWILTKNPPER